MFPVLSDFFLPQIGRGARQQILKAQCIHVYTPSQSKSIIWNHAHYSTSVVVPPEARTKEKDRSCKQFTTIGKIFNYNTPKDFGSSDKISIVGLDDIGMAIVYTLLVKEITNNICMIDMNEDILQGEHMDLQSSALFLNNPKIMSSKDPADTSNSKVCIITTGTYKGRDENELDYVARNAGIIRAIVGPLAKYSPNAIYVVASDPVDILSYVTWRLIGIPKQKIIGTGTIVDTARFRYMLAEKFGVAPTCCHAYIIGEHGSNNSVPVWSNVSIAGVRLVDLNPQIGTDKDPEMWNELFVAAVRSDSLVRHLKGTVSWSVGLAVAEICKAILKNSYTVFPVSTYVKGEHSIRDEVFLSLPCVVGRAGVTDIIRQTLTDHESSVLRRGAENIAHMQEAANKIIS
uniref:L-lactate dehydrogenase n=1 Tax=Heliothis virescens TaxID=7102 RepID=A0A2A4K4H4_HELVI